MGGNAHWHGASARTSLSPRRRNPAHYLGVRSCYVALPVLVLVITERTHGSRDSLLRKSETSQEWRISEFILSTEKGVDDRRQGKFSEEGTVLQVLLSGVVVRDQFQEVYLRDSKHFGFLGSILLRGCFFLFSSSCCCFTSSQIVILLIVLQKRLIVQCFKVEPDFNLVFSSC